MPTIAMTTSNSTSVNARRFGVAEPFADRPTATAWGGYAIPTRAGLLFGATYDPDDVGTEVRDRDHDRNLAALSSVLPDLAARLTDVALEGRASIRATTPDRMPIAGPAPDGAPGLFVLTGLGSRGFSLAPLLAEHVAALALGAPSPLPGPLAALVDPDRFRQRSARRGSHAAGAALYQGSRDAV